MSYLYEEHKRQEKIMRRLLIPFRLFRYFVYGMGWFSLFQYLFGGHHGV